MPIPTTVAPAREISHFDRVLVRVTADHESGRLTRMALSELVTEAALDVERVWQIATETLDNGVFVDSIDLHEGLELWGVSEDSRSMLAFQILQFASEHQIDVGVVRLDRLERIRRGEAGV